MTAMLTVEEVQASVQRIRDCAHDDETAHSSEDGLHQEVLAAIAEGRCSDPVACAAEALKTKDIEFCRWCA